MRFLHTKREQQYLSFKIFFLLIMPFFVFTSINGCEGIEGPQGAEGEQGLEGPIGPAGEDGSIIHSGTGVPHEDIGKDGDYYLDKDTGELYGPKKDGNWGTPISLQGSPGEDGEDGADGSKGEDGEDGQDGQDGEDGSQIYAGSGAPDASIGTIGDYYLDKDNYDLYGPKTNSGWGTPINLQGPSNVMYSSWIEFESSNWSSLQTEYFTDFREYRVSVPQINEDIRNQGIVLVYITFLCCNDVNPLPVVIDNRSKLSFDYIVGEIQIKHSNFPNASYDPGIIGAGNKFRYVIIPGSVALKSNLSEEQLKNMSYKDTKHRFNITE